MTDSLVIDFTGATTKERLAALRAADNAGVLMNSGDDVSAWIMDHYPEIDSIVINERDNGRRLRCCCADGTDGRDAAPARVVTPEFIRAWFGLTPPPPPLTNQEIADKFGVPVESLMIVGGRDG